MGLKKRKSGGKGRQVIEKSGEDGKKAGENRIPLENGRDDRPVNLSFRSLLQIDRGRATLLTVTHYNSRMYT